MIINWYGEGCFKIQTGGVSLLVDPFESSTGLTPPRGKVDIVIKTLTGWPLKKDEEESTTYIYGSGSYEIQGVTINGFALPKDSSDTYLKTAYKVVAEDITLGFLGHVSEDLTPEALDDLHNAQILFVPAGGKPFMGPEAVAKLIKQLNPKIIVASFFKIPGLKRGGSDTKALANEIGPKLEELDKLTIRKKEIIEQKGARFVSLQV
ncbi:MAG: MBL fold metallo-hydrolase [bacterium]|nr:MBL fold metallo-hydrolase [bacterium]